MSLVHCIQRNQSIGKVAPFSILQYMQAIHLQDLHLVKEVFQASNIQKGHCSAESDFL